MQLSLKRPASGWVSPVGSLVAVGIFLFVTKTDCFETCDIYSSRNLPTENRVASIFTLKE
jgi:hypothetical protein